jgi:hypothetical protein
MPTLITEGSWFVLGLVGYGLACTWARKTAVEDRTASWLPALGRQTCPAKRRVSSGLVDPDQRVPALQKMSSPTLHAATPSASTPSPAYTTSQRKTLSSHKNQIHPHPLHHKTLQNHPSSNAGSQDPPSTALYSPSSPTATSPKSTLPPPPPPSPQIQANQPHLPPQPVYTHVPGQLNLPSSHPPTQS